MAHTCTQCGIVCHCHGDIDDLNFGERDIPCDHCPDEDAEPEPEYNASPLYTCCRCGTMGEWDEGWHWIGRVDDMKPACPRC